MITIDTHAHWFPPQWVDLVAKEGGKNGAEVATDATGKITKFSAPEINRAGFGAQYVEIPRRLKIMDDGRVDMHALSLTSPMVYWATPDFGLKLSRAFNDACAEAHLRQQGCARITLDTTEPLRRAMRFYEKHGYRPSGRITDFFGMPLHEYVKAIGTVQR